MEAVEDLEVELGLLIQTQLMVRLDTDYYMRMIADEDDDSADDDSADDDRADDDVCGKKAGPDLAHGET